VAASLLSPVFEPGFFASGPVRVALIVGGIVAVVSGLVGVFTVVRGQSFAGHAFADIGTAGGSAAFLVGAPTLYGFVSFNVLAAGVMELIGIRRPRGRDLATGIVLGASLGLAALFLYEDTIHTSTTGATINVLFGSIFTISSSTVPTIGALGVVSVALIALFYRPLLFSSVSYDLAAARGVPVRLIGAGYLLALALAVSLSAVTIGAILSTALLIGPAAISLRVASRTGVAIAVAAGLGVFACWAGTLIAYDSSDWTGGKGWPASFCIVAVIFLLYFASAIVARRRRGCRMVTVGPRGSVSPAVAVGAAGGATGGGAGGAAGYPHQAPIPRS
jgi:zinc/manganese transport system permease protein